MRVLRGTRSRLAAISALLFALAAAGIAYATLPDVGGVIHGCYQKKSGELRVIDMGTGSSCREGEAPLDWHQTGPQGPPGDPGSLSVMLRTVQRQVTLAPGESAFVASQCSSGEVAINGSPSGSFPKITISQSALSWDGQNPSGWALEFRNDDTAQRTETIGVIALCAAGTLSAG